MFSQSTVGLAQAVDGDINKIIDLGPWALFILLIANKIIETISKKKDDNEILKNLNEERALLEKKIDELATYIDVVVDKTNSMYEWHNKDDQDGTKIWYFKRSFKDSLDTLIETIRKQNEVINHLNDRNEKLIEIMNKNFN